MGLPFWLNLATKIKGTPSYIMGPVAGFQTRKSNIGSFDDCSRSEVSLIASLCAFNTLKWTRKGLVSSRLHFSKNLKVAVFISGKGIIFGF